ncbi:DinB family protein [Mycolicibacterium goodii]|uniref:DinB family protein n=1 Tax=Mycolicibacterium goodii TaxID=134601 RepID=UPI001BDBFB12|nr:DinB family protein [Mycolicibacterium goodii]MBU8815641.1 DinB family protein [Mycolicibacterium goodii]
MEPAADPIEPDTKDWTWVLHRACQECGFNPSALHHTAVANHIRDDATAWVQRLNRSDVTVRTRPGMWSVLEYGCHIRDVHRIFDHRVQLMLTETDPRFPNWDQDAPAVADDYASQDPLVVATELYDAATVVADRYDGVPDDAWSRRGLRSNGSEFTVATIALYHLHDIVHHAHDVASM